MKRTFYIEDLIGSKIVTAEGKHLGHVVDLQFTGGPEAVALKTRFQKISLGTYCILIGERMPNCMYYITALPVIPICVQGSTIAMRNAHRNGAALNTNRYEQRVS